MKELNDPNLYVQRLITGISIAIRCNTNHKVLVSLYFLKTRLTGTAQMWLQQVKYGI